MSYAFSAESLSEIRQEHPHLLINLLCSMDLALSLENAQGVSIPSLELLVTAGDCLLAATGQLNPAEPDEPAPAA